MSIYLCKEIWGVLGSFGSAAHCVPSLADLSDQLGVLLPEGRYTFWYHLQ